MAAGSVDPAGAASGAFSFTLAVSEAFSHFSPKYLKAQHQLTTGYCILYWTEFYYIVESF